MPAVMCAPVTCVQLLTTGRNINRIDDELGRSHCTVEYSLERILFLINRKVLDVDRIWDYLILFL